MAIIYGDPVDETLFSTNNPILSLPIPGMTKYPDAPATTAFSVEAAMTDCLAIPAKTNWTETREATSFRGSGQDTLKGGDEDDSRDTAFGGEGDDLFVQFRLAEASSGVAEAMTMPSGEPGPIPFSGKMAPTSFSAKTASIRSEAAQRTTCSTDSAVTITSMVKAETTALPAAMRTTSSSAARFRQPLWR